MSTNNMNDNLSGMHLDYHALGSCISLIPRFSRVMEWKLSLRRTDAVVAAGIISPYRIAEVESAVGECVGRY